MRTAVLMLVGGFLMAVGASPVVAQMPQQVGTDASGGFQETGDPSRSSAEEQAGAPPPAQTGQMSGASQGWGQWSSPPPWSDEKAKSKPWGDHISE